MDKKCTGGFSTMLALSLLVTSQSHIFISFFKVDFSHIFQEYEEENLPIAHLYLIFKGLFSSHFQEYEEEKPYGNTVSHHHFYRLSSWFAWFSRTWRKRLIVPMFNIIIFSDFLHDLHLWPVPWADPSPCRPLPARTHREWRW